MDGRAEDGTQTTRPLSQSDDERHAPEEDPDPFVLIGCACDVAFLESLQT